MPDRVKINKDIVVGAQPSEAELKVMADEGIRAVINIREEGEPMQELSPEEEGEKVRELGMEYYNVPVSIEEKEDETAEKFCEVLEKTPKPVFVHCKLGERAGGFVLMAEGLKKGASGEEVIEEAQEKKILSGEEALSDFIRKYVDKHVPQK